MGPRTAVTAVFFLNGASFSSWYSRLPAIQDRLDLGPGAVGLALLGAPLGLLVAQPAVGAIIARHGSRPLVAAAPLWLATVLLPALAGNTLTLFAAVTLVGAANGALDIAMNAQGLAVESAAGRRLFGSLHAAFSFGALVGAGLAGAVAGLGIAPLPHLAAIAGIGAIAATVIVVPGLLHDRPDREQPRPRLARPSRRLALYGAIAFCVLLAEGAVFDWSAIFLATEQRADPGLAPMGLAAFSLTMGVGRLLADPAAGRFGDAAVARWGAISAAAGLGLALTTGNVGLSLTGFAVMGLGLAAVFPMTLRAAANNTATAGPDLAAVASFGYLGLFLGPPTIGILAEQSSLRWALVLVCAVCVVAAALTVRTAVHPSRTDHT
ncbi:MAG: MFS transporter [Actinomycetota bacterium]|nr:MFS transporter [Actinomycetota bacterium]